MTLPSSAIPSVPAPDVWSPLNRHDEQRASLLRPLFSYRQQILDLYPRVPLAAERGTASVPVAALLLLWERWNYLRGPCPNCGSDALGTSFGGLLSIGSVGGCCLGCASVVTRPVGGMGVIARCLRAYLGDTPYRLWPDRSWAWSLSRLQRPIVAVLQELGAEVRA